MKLSSVLITTGFACIAVAFIIFVATFYPVIIAELGYQLNRSQGELLVKKAVIPKDKGFGIVIPKIAANAKIIPNVDPYNRLEYQVALTKGVAHAQRTSFPDENGNMFLFSHSSVNFYEANRYNSVFYLINELEAGDEIYIYYNGDKYRYLVSGKKIVDASEVQYLESAGLEKTLTLMTCWPPGTTYKRVLVTAKQVQEEPF